MTRNAAALAGLAALGLAAPAAGARPALQPTALQPLTVRGVHFVGGESVLVTVLGGAGHAARRVTAGPDGTWVIAFPTLQAKGRRFTVRAVGNAGSAALWASRAMHPATPVAPKPTS